MKTGEKGTKFRIWHIPNPPRPGFLMDVESIDEGKKFLNLIADYDLYLGESLISSNAQGIDVFEDGEWLNIDEDSYAEA